MASVTKGKLKWYGHVRKREEGHVLRRMAVGPVTAKRRQEDRKPRG